MSKPIFPQYPSTDDAAIAAIQAIVKRSIKEHVEYAGRIIDLGNGKFSYTPPRKGTRDNSDPGPRAAGYKNVGTYHTHGGEFAETDEIFSPQDKIKATLAKEVSYLGTPYQRILKFTPVDLLAPSDSDSNPLGMVEVLINVYTLQEIVITGS